MIFSGGPLRLVHGAPQLANRLLGALRAPQRTPARQGSQHVLLHVFFPRFVPHIPQAEPVRNVFQSEHELGGRESGESKATDEESEEQGVRKVCLFFSSSSFLDKSDARVSPGWFLSARVPAAAEEEGDARGRVSGGHAEGEEAPPRARRDASNPM